MRRLAAHDVEPAAEPRSGRRTGIARQIRQTRPGVPARVEALEPQHVAPARAHHSAGDVDLALDLGGREIAPPLRHRRRRLPGRERYEQR